MTITEILQRAAAAAPAAPALEAPDRLPLSYMRLWAAVDESIGHLQARGIRRQDRIAVCLPNGPEMAVAFLAATGAGACAPLNPDYRQQEFEYLLKDLAPACILLPISEDTPVRRAASGLGIDIVEVEAVPEEPAGVFRLTGRGGAAPANAGPARDPDVALILHTSGTTSRPKMVPLTHANLCASAENVRAALALAPADRCLNVMPLFHIHGLVASVLASLAAGGTVICTPGFVAPRFFGWMIDTRPTWYTAVPTIHLSILERAESGREVASAGRLRFIRSSSAALPPKVMAGLESALGAPVIEAYGMTEAAHQIASNPLPPRARKPGSVGLPAGPTIGILNPEGQLLDQGQVGEVVIRGANVTSGYLLAGEANAQAFSAGWFRTGDLGRLDSDGYLFLTGRIKEVINRGGEKISPREIDEVLLEHPAVAQAVAFALPHRRLGEEVAAVVILRPGQSATERDLREYVSHRLADFKVPSRVVMVTEIPTGPTGKVQRVGLAMQLGLVAPAGRIAATLAPPLHPRTAFEAEVLAVWREVLGREDIGVRDHLLDVGGDSLQATMIAARLRDRFGVALALLDMLDAPTVEAQARLLQAQRPSDEADSLEAIP